MLPAGVNRRAVIQLSAIASAPTPTFKFASGHVDFTARTRTAVTADAPGGMTIHHKISQAHLKRLTRFLGIVMESGGAEQKGAALKLIGIVQTYMRKHGDTNPSVFRALNNMPLNLAYGPTSRVHHMADLFDGTVDATSGEDTTTVVALHGTTKPKLFRTLSARSIPLSAIDRQIMTLPETIVALHEKAQADETTALLDDIAASLQVAITADDSPTKTPFYQADHWAKTDGKYTRATTAAVFQTWDPSIKPTTSLADRNRAERLEKDREDFQKGPSKPGPKVRVGRLVQDVFAILALASRTYTAASVENRYKAKFDYTDGIRIRVLSKAIKWGAGRKVLDDDAPDVDYYDVEVEEALADLKFVVGA